jgi:hypothetical protein
MSDDYEIIDWAVAYGEQKWRIFPCKPEDKAPLTKHGFYDASSSPNFARYHWNKHPRALIGLWCGHASGVVCVDVDCKNGKDGFASLRQLTGGRTSIVTPTSETPSGGRHYFFRAVPGKVVRSTTSKVAIGIDIRGDDGYAILPPGDGRRWYANLDPWSVAFAPRPNWVPTEDPAPKGPTPGTPLPDPIAHHDGTCTSAYGEAAITKAYIAIADAPDGCQESTLNRECFSIGAHSLPAVKSATPSRCSF